MEQIGNYALPVIILLVLAHGLWKKTPVFDAFLVGAKEGLYTALRLLPTLIGLLTAVAMVSASGAFDVFAQLLSPVAAVLGLPKQVMPLLLIHPISGSGATAVLTNLFEQYGPDSTIGKIASVMCGSGETTVYAYTVYYGSVGITKTRHTLPVALLADLAVAILSGLGVRLLLP